MVRSLALLALLAASSGAVSPVQKVIELLDENKVKIQSDLAGEEKEMQEYAEFCDTELEEKGYAIRTAVRTIDQLKAEIEDATAEIASLSEDIVSLGTEIASKEKQLDEAELERETERKSFSKNDGELVGSIDELERAVAVVKKDAASFLQTKRNVGHGVIREVKKTMKVIAKILSASWVNQKDFKALKGFVQTDLTANDGDDLKLKARQEPEVPAYASAVGGIVEELENMKAKAEEQLSTLRSGEMREEHTFAMMAQSLTDAIKFGKEKVANTKSAVETATEESGKAKNELTETENAKSADEEYVKSLGKECSDAREEWDARQASAKEEMAVIEKAKSILSSRVGVFAQVGKGDADTEDQKLRERVVNKLRQISRKFGSYALMEMVSAAAADPFEKIKGLIEQMISKLLSEANEAATHKEFCDEEISKSNAAKADKNMKIEKLTSRLDKAKSKKALLEENAKTVEGQIAATDKATAEATTIRKEEHETYLTSSKDFKEAAEACSEAVTVLREYYEGASLAQVGKGEAKAKAPSFGGAKTDSAHAIISILEMSAENFEKMYLQVEQEEREAVRAFGKLQIESKVSKMSMQKEVKGMLSETKSLERAIRQGEEDYDSTHTELEAVMTYMEKLKPQCESKRMSYEEKKSRREAEIEGLKEALSILESGAALVQTAPRLRP